MSRGIGRYIISAHTRARLRELFRARFSGNPIITYLLIFVMVYYVGNQPLSIEMNIYTCKSVDSLKLYTNYNDSSIDSQIQFPYKQ